MGMLFMQTGMAIDTAWAAHLGVKERGLDITGDVALKTALTLAEKQSILWLQVLGEKMTKIGAGSFWNDVTQKAPSKEERAEEYFLRVKIKAGDSGNAGTDADVRVKFDDEAEQLADYSPNVSHFWATTTTKKAPKRLMRSAPSRRCHKK
jgi:hypothetical protein